MNSKKFDSPGSFATSEQALSVLGTSFMFMFLFLGLYLNKWIIILGLLASFLFQMIFEYKFLIFAKKYFGFRMLFFSLFGIQVLNIGIVIGTLYFFSNYIKNYFIKKIN